MLFIREIVAFLQLVLMPGLLLMAVVRPQLGKFRSFLPVPVLSLLLNYVFVSLTFVLGIFNWWMCWIYTAAVWAAVFYLWRKEISGLLKCRLSDTLTNVSGQICEAYRAMSCGSRERRVITAIAFAGAAAGVICGINFLWQSVNGVFIYWDSALSWNFWAEAWSRNEYPQDVSFYPQLVPENWALVYKLLGCTICFVPKTAISVFPLLTSLMFLEYGIRKRRIDMLLAIAIYSFYFHNVGYIEHGGELDLLMAFCGTAVFFLINYAAEAENSGMFFRRLYLTVMVIAAAGLTKQAGLYLILAFAVFTGVLLRREFIRLQISRSRIIRQFAAMTLLLILLVAPSYIIAAKRIESGLDYSNTQLVTETIYGGKNYFERFVCSVRLFTLRLQCGLPWIRSARYAVFDLENGWWISLLQLYRLQLPLGIIMIALNIFLLYGCLKKRNMFAVSAVVLVFFLIWSMLFCYDLRNLSLVMPLLALLSAGGIEYFSDTGCLRKVYSWQLWQAVPVAVVIFLLGYAGEFFPRQRVSRYVEEIRNTGESELNFKLMQYHQEYTGKREVAGLPEKTPVVLTDYAYIKLLAPYRNNWRSCNFSIQSDEIFRDFCARIDEPEITAVVLPSYASESVKEEISRRVASGKLIKYFESRDYTMYIKPF